jgi:hypothetical protein
MRCATLGFFDVRVRHHELKTGQLARIELGPDELARIFVNGASSQSRGCLQSRGLHACDAGFGRIPTREFECISTDCVQNSAAVVALRWGCKPNSVCPRSLARRESFICCSTPETLCPFGPRNGPFLEFPIWPCTGRGLPCLRDCSWSGGLLPHLFTLIPIARDGIFSVALSVDAS